LLEKSGGGEKQNVGRVVQWTGRNVAVCSNFVNVLRPERWCDSRYLTYLHRSLYGVGWPNACTKQTTGIQNLDLRAYLRAAVPDLQGDEQQRVAEFLDRECDRLQQLAQSDAPLRAALGRAMAAVSTQAFERHGRDTMPLWAASDPARPIMYGIVLPGEHVADGVPIVKGGDVENGRTHPEALSRTTTAIDTAYARSRLRCGDVLVTIRGSYGASAVVPPELAGANITQDTARVAPRPGSVGGGWLRLMMSSAQVGDALSLVATGATIKGVNIRDLKRVRVPVPSSEAQRAEVADATKALGRLGIAEGKRERLTAALTAYRDSLIHEAVTGKLDVTKVSDRQMDERLHAAAEDRLDEVPA